LIVTELLWFLRGDTNIKFLVDNNCHIWDGDAYKNYLNVVMYEKPDYLHEKHGHLNMSVEKEGDWYLTLTQEEFINKIKTNDEFAKRWGELGPIYGKQWRKWVGYEQNTKIDGVYSEYAIDQIANLINDLKTNPDSRRLMVNAWNVGELDQMVLPPCHYGFQVYTSEMSNDERCQHWAELIGKDLSYTKNLTNKKLDDLGCPTRKISLSWNQRSVDTFLGLPFNIASYGLLLEIIAKEVNMVPDELIGNLGDTHLYLNHIEQAKEQIGREYTHEERTELLKQAMGEENYNKALDELMPFGGGLSEYYDSYKIPKRTREPFLLPTLNFSNWYKNANDEKQSEIVFNEWIESIKIGDFKVENYQSHSAISAPLSN
jgi:thymidylate synthase